MSSANNKKQNKLNRVLFSDILIENTYEFCKNTSLHGLKYVICRELNIFERVFFGFSLFFIFASSFYFLFVTYLKWENSSMYVGIKPEPTTIIKDPFPAITVCNSNQALKSKVAFIKKYSLENKIFLGIISIHTYRKSLEYDMLMFLCENDHECDKNITYTWSTLQQFILNISQPCEDMILGCRYGGEIINCTKHFTPIITDETLCCSFNKIHPKFMYLDRPPNYLSNLKPNDYIPVDWDAEHGYYTTLKENFYPCRVLGVGHSQGLSLLLDVQEDEYFCSTSAGSGFKILLHGPNEAPNLREIGIPLTPGQEIKLNISPQKFITSPGLKHLNKKYRYCLFNNENKLKFFAHYSQKNCELECLAQTQLAICHCISFYMPRINRTARLCSVNDNPCILSIRYRLFPNITQCIGECYPSCYSLYSTKTLFTSKILKDSFMTNNLILKNLSNNYISRNIVLIHMYFDEYTYRSIESHPYFTTVDFIASIGGLLGLFLGGSFITIVELFFFAIIRPCVRLFYGKNDTSLHPAIFGKMLVADLKNVTQSSNSHTPFKTSKKQRFPNAVGIYRVTKGYAKKKSTI